jgi:hypothetical protein
MEIELDHELMKGVVNVLGWDGLLNYLATSYHHLELYSVSRSWFDDPKFILKARGSYGDLIVRFSKTGSLAI